MSDGLLAYALEDGVAVIRLDDGKANAFSPAMVEAVGKALDQAEADNAGAVLLAGRPGRFSAGFDLSVMQAGPRPCRELVESGAHLGLRMYEFGRPVVGAITGHALAAGAVFLCCMDVRIGADIPAKIGLNEVAIGMPLPIFAVEVARDRLSRRHFYSATALARVYSPSEAVDAGYLDAVVPAEDLEDTAMAEARRLAALPDPAYGITKKWARHAVADYIRDTLTEDMDRIG